ILGATVAEITDFDPEADFEAFEHNYNDELRPRYVLCKVPIARLQHIHRLEAAGFRFIEVQIASRLRLKKGARYDTSDQPYSYQPVETANDLERVLDIAGSTFSTGRFGLDPDIGEVEGGAFYREYTRRSFARRHDDELIHKLQNRQSGEIIGFNTCVLTGTQTCRLLNAGVAPRYKQTGLGTVLNYYVFNDLAERGIKTIDTRQSAANFPILNTELVHFGFRVVEAYVVMRKLYEK
ncbi:MAG: GNAT family N-acetyltransferase, partial [Gammaproteobacteria bacterium]|nr:GNAT family N-acetyltransferase [Gammaproteobacteria bacterium]